MRWSVGTLGLLLTFAAAGCNDGDAPRPPTSPSAHPSATGGFPGGIGPASPEYRPAASDEYGKWLTVEIGGASVEVPTGDEWHLQGVLDPCFGDGRYYLLLENRQTADRLRVDMAPPAVRAISADTKRLDGIMERVLRSATGTHTPPVVLQTFGPNPTSTTCASEDPESIPTLIIDTFTPPPATVTESPTASVTPPAASSETGGAP